MGLLEDYAVISGLARKGTAIVTAAAVNTVRVAPEQDTGEGETQITVTPAQKALLLAQLAAINTAIKTKASGLP